MKMNKNKTVLKCMNVTGDVWAKFKILSIENDVTMGEMLLMMIERFKEVK